MRRGKVAAWDTASRVRVLAAFLIPASENTHPASDDNGSSTWELDTQDFRLQAMVACEQ